MIPIRTRADTHVLNVNGICVLNRTFTESIAAIGIKNTNAAIIKTAKNEFIILPPYLAEDGHNSE
jgi:hypothetical protein